MATINLLFSLCFISLWFAILAAPWPRPFMPIAAVRARPVKTTMHNVGNVDSIGNAIFLGGKRRKTCPHSTFMFHGVGFDLNSPTRLEEKGLRESLGTIDADHKRIGSVISQETTLKSKDINRLFRQAQTKDAAYALGSGIVHAIEDVAIPAVIQLVFQG